MLARHLRPSCIVMLALLASGASAHRLVAAPLDPAAGERVASNAPAVASEILDAIASGQSDAAEDLRRVIDMDDAFRVYHRDHQVLVAMTARKNLFVGDKRAGERRAADLVREVLQTRFSHMLGNSDGFPGLDAAAVRVVFVEPDAFDDCPGRRPARLASGGGTLPPIPTGGAGLWSRGWATPAPCTSCR